MEIRKVTINRFRGIHSLDWQPRSSLTCIVGPGDSCKSTILDALEVTLGTRWVSFTDFDFTDGDTTQPIEIEVTVGQLPNEALRETRLGLSLRGWRVGQGLCDEPETDDEPVVTVRLTVDSSLEPAWELITERQSPRPLHPRDRALLGLVRLGGDAERHLTWGQGSALARLTSSDKNQAAPLLAEAYRTARDRLKAGTLPALDVVATQVRDKAIALGAYTGDCYSAGLDTQRSSMSLGSLAIHGDGVPLRLAGLGTRRLVALAVQQMSIPDGAIVLIDEIEHGLEPHRIRHALKSLRAALAEPEGVGQVILTTHAATSVVELSCNQLAICRRSQGIVDLRAPAPHLQSLIRRVAEIFLSRKVLVCEGKTEVGLLKGLRDFWAHRNADEPLEARGVTIADGNGNEAASTAYELAKLGYSVALLRDSDVALTSEEDIKLNQLNINVFQWDGMVSTECRVFLDVSASTIQQLINIAIDSRGEESVLDSIRNELETSKRLPQNYLLWNLADKSDCEIRQAIGRAAKNKNWFKRVDLGESVGLLLADDLTSNEHSPLAQTLAAAEGWVYGQ